jgi:uncharacterized protein (DUF58 family)
VTGTGLPRPARVRRAGAVLAAFALALYVVARSTGAGWDVVVLCGLVAVLVAGALLPVPALAHVRVRAEAPRDATAGRPLRITVGLTGRARGLQVRVRAPEGSWLRADAPCRGDAVVVPARRGLVPGVVVELRGASPLGLLAWRRLVTVPLERPIEVGPMPTPVPFRAAPGRALTPRDDARAGAEGDDLTRGVREYVDGDPIRRLHWPASAATGTLMVRELEGPRRPHLIVVVDLRGHEPEAAASAAAGLANDALRHGALVELATAEAEGPRLAAVGSRAEVGRRLARAVAGAPAAGPFRAGAQVERLGHRERA